MDFIFNLNEINHYHYAVGRRTNLREKGLQNFKQKHTFSYNIIMLSWCNI